ncbi:phosphotransferase family protein [Actinoplanes sp. NPDC051343]|uniref:phosphotransferase family protein n=1 Tax=Actinoplanes sp. NPDC051343 TaxID=3363906 RepID=UPI00378E05ED
MDDVVADACHQMGLDGSDARFVQHSANALFRLPKAGIMLRLSPEPVDYLIRITRALTAAGVPVAHLAPGVPQPVNAAGWWATAWTLHPILPNRLPAAALARPLATLHRVELPNLASWNLVSAIRALLMPLSTADSTWPRVHLGLSMPQLIGRLLACCDEIEHGLATATWALPAGTIHGDAHPGNLLRTATGRVVLCDFDTIARGPRETDLVPAAHGVTRFGRERADYERFAERYGFDLLNAPCWPILRRLRDLQLAIYLLPRLPADPVTSQQLEHRLRTVLGDDDSARWHRFTAFA